MEKLAYVLWRRPGTDPTAVERAVLDHVAPALTAAGAARVRAFVEDPAASVFRQGTGPDGGLLVGTVSFWLDSVDDRGACEAAVAAAGCRAAGYLVTESVPKDYGAARDWPDGQRSPGIGIVTVFDKKPGITDDEFFRIWHGEHTPMTFEIHPVWLYIRNAVARPLTPGAPALRAIVEEAVPTRDDLLDFDRFFGGHGDRERMKANIARTNAHLASFADTAGLQTCAMAEYILTT